MTRVQYSAWVIAVCATAWAQPGTKHHRMLTKFEADADKRISLTAFATAQHAAGQ